MGVGGGLGLRSSNGRTGRFCSRIASARVSRFWEGDVVGSVSRGGTISRCDCSAVSEVENGEIWVREIGGGAGNSPRLIIAGVLTGDCISISKLLSLRPAMARSVSWSDDC